MLVSGVSAVRREACGSGHLGLQGMQEGASRRSIRATVSFATATDELQNRWLWSLAWCCNVVQLLSGVTVWWHFGQA